MLAEMDPRSLAHSIRLRQLYDIGRLLMTFEDVERTVPQVLARVHQALPLRSATLLLRSGPGVPRTFVWRTPGDTGERLPAAFEEAHRVFAYLAHLPLEAVRHPPGGSTRTYELPVSPPPRAEESAPGDFVTLPLVVTGGSVFGVLQFEGLRPLDELDVLFADAVASSLAVAIDRAALATAKVAWSEERRASAERAERTHRFFSEMGALLASSLDYRITLAAVARLSVADFADICFIDEREEDGTVRRLEVAYAQEKHRLLAEHIRTGLSILEVPTTDPRILDRHGPSITEVRAGTTAPAPANEHDTRVMRELHVEAMIIVPLTARGRSLGSLAFIAAVPPRRFSLADLHFAEEIGRRAAMAVDNARLFRDAQRSIASRQELLAIVSHDLRSPLTAILVMSGMLLEGEVKPEAARRYAETIERSAKQMKRLIEDLLQMAHIEAGRLSVERRPYPPDALVHEAVQLLEPVARHRAIDLAAVPGDEGQLVLCDRERVLQVFSNLVGNAIKFTPEGGRITLRTRPFGDVVLFSVTDTGPGIPADRLPHLFDRYWQAKETSKMGYGLGLAISKGIVESLGGSLWAESTPGEGSTFFFTLPVPGRAEAEVGAGA